MSYSNYSNDQFVSVFSNYMRLAKNNETQAIRNADIINRFASKCKNDVFLEIGPGAANTSKLIAPNYNKYIAIEPNVKYHSQLQEIGAVVYSEPFFQDKLEVNYDLFISLNQFYYYNVDNIDIVLNNVLSMKSEKNSVAIVLLESHMSCKLDDFIMNLLCKKWMDIIPCIDTTRIRDANCFLNTVDINKYNINITEIEVPLEFNNIEEIVDFVSFKFFENCLIPGTKLHLSDKIINEMISDIRSACLNKITFPYKSSQFNVFFIF